MLFIQTIAKQWRDNFILHMFVSLIYEAQALFCCQMGLNFGDEFWTSVSSSVS